mmetsp:Transcript_21051/g.42796  ORF Transcript_21051/g.42796 Transcript_21051/m.42796 type:complete len:128 (+) Transcript_21051:985-1368(+)
MSPIRWITTARREVRGVTTTTWITREGNSPCRIQQPPRYGDRKCNRDSVVFAGVWCERNERRDDPRCNSKTSVTASHFQFYPRRSVGGYMVVNEVYITSRDTDGQGGTNTSPDVITQMERTKESWAF